MVAWFVAVLIAVAIAAIAIVLMPRPHTPRPDATKDLENPTADAGRPIPVPFGTIMIKGLNVMWYGDKGQRTYKRNA
jgi:hypothetical protein